MRELPPTQMEIEPPSGYSGMPNGQFVRDEPKGHHRCPGNSGKKYKKCCKTKGTIK